MVMIKNVSYDYKNVAFNPVWKDWEKYRLHNNKNQSVKTQRKKGPRLRFPIWRFYYEGSINYYSLMADVWIVTRYQYFFHNKYSEIPTKSLWIYMCCTSYRFFTPAIFFLSNWTRSNYYAKLFIPAFVLTILCRNAASRKIRSVFAKRWCVPLTRRWSETDPSARKFTLSPMLTGGMMLPQRGETPGGRISPARCQGYARTINGPGCNQRDYKRVFA